MKYKTSYSRQLYGCASLDADCRPGEANLSLRKQMLQEDGCGIKTNYYIWQNVNVFFVNQKNLMSTVTSYPGSVMSADTIRCRKSHNQVRLKVFVAEEDHHKSQRINIKE